MMLDGIGHVDSDGSANLVAFFIRFLHESREIRISNEDLGDRDEMG
jgi:hypothetical protein